MPTLINTYPETQVNRYCNISRLRLPFPAELAPGSPFFKLQNKKCLRGPEVEPATAAAAANGAVSVPEPRTPKENIRSNT